MIADEMQEAVVIIRSATQPSRQPQEINYCTAVTPDGAWRRLYPLSFRAGEDVRFLKRWDKVRFRAIRPTDDARPESMRVMPQSMTVVGELKRDEREAFITPLVVDALSAAPPDQSLILLKPKAAQFVVQKKSAQLLAEEAGMLQRAANGQAVATGPVPFPYAFKYKFTAADGEHEIPYQDAEMDATFVNLSRTLGEAQTVARIVQVCGREYPQRGMMLALSRPAVGASWLISGVVCADEFDAAIGPRNLDLLA